MDYYLAMKSVLNLKNSDIHHVLCNWNMEKRLSELKIQLIILIWIEDKSNFDDIYEFIKSKLLLKKLDKSLKYIEEAWIIEHKWARSYLPCRNALNLTSRIHE